MSTPFPLEEQSASERLYSGPMTDPWHGPVKPGFFTGLGYDEDNAFLGPSTPVLTGVGKAISKVVAGAAGAASSFYSAEASLGDELASAVGLHPSKNPIQALADELASTQAAAQKNVDALTPNPQTTGTAFQIVHGVSEGATLAVAGGAAGGLPGAVALTGATEGGATYQESLKAGTSPGVAAARAGVSAVASGAGVLIPGGFGSTLAAKLLTGAGAQVGLGLASRYADHKILDANGYPEMAAQQKIWDSTQVLTDALLGVAFGGLAHLHGSEAKAIEVAAREPGVVDAALVANLAVQDRNLAVGVPVDSAATHAHADALQVSTEQLLEGKPNDVSQTGVNEAKFATRPIDEARQAEAQAIAREHQLSEEIAAHNEYAFRAGAADRAALPEPPELPALSKRNAQTPDAREDSILQYLAKHPEGLSSAEAEAQGIDKASFGDRAAMVGIKRAFRKEGMSFDRAAEMLHEQGYPVTDEQGHYSPNVLLDRISEELAGTPQHSTRNTRAELEAAHERVHDNQMRASLHEAAPEFAQEDQATQDFTTLAARAHEYDPAAVERILASGSDVDNARQLQSILDIGRERQLAEYEVTKGAEVHSEAPGASSPKDAGATGRAGTRAPGTAAGAEPAGDRAGAAAAGGTARTESGATAATGTAAGHAVDPLTAKVHEALQERPSLEVTNEDGKPTRAADLLRQVQEDAARETADFQKAVTAATNCFGRRGS
jgi:hypothetical protein